MKFAHLGDCHLGSWRQPELQELNFKSFQLAIERCLQERVEFVLIAGDLFDSAYPPVEILKEVFAEFRKLKEAAKRSGMLSIREAAIEAVAEGVTTLQEINRVTFVA